MRHLCLLVAGAVMVSGVLGFSGAAVAGEKEDLAAIAKVREMEMASINDATFDHVSHVYAKDVKYYPPNEVALEGTDAVKAWLGGLIEQFDAKLNYTDANVVVRDDMAFEQYAGIVTMTPKAGGETMTQNLRGIHIYKKGADGAWKIAYDIWNTDTPAH